MVHDGNPFTGWTNEISEEVFSKWPIGEKVRKAGGYDWPGRVCGYNITSTGTVTVGVENRLSPGTVHVFPPHQLVLEDRDDRQILTDVAARMR